MRKITIQGDFKKECVSPNFITIGQYYLTQEEKLVHKYGNFIKFFL